MRLNEELWVKYADWEKWYGFYICKLCSIFINIYSNIFKQKLKQKMKDNKKKINIRATLKRIKKHLTEIKIIIHWVVRVTFIWLLTKGKLSALRT